MAALLSSLHQDSVAMETCLTEIFVSDVHFGSSVDTTIKDRLSTLYPQPLSVHVSISSRSVTVHHFKELSPRTIQSALEDAGFDVVQNPPQLDDDASDSSCTQRSDKHSLTSLTTPMSSVDDGPFLATFSVGGMTCSACSNAVTSAISEVVGVSNVTVSLLERFAIAVVERKELANDVCEVVEDCGFEAQVISVESAKDSGSDLTNEVNTRTISLRVDGMSSQTCSQRVMSTLSSFGSQIEILKPLSMYTDPILTLSYQPDSPSFTIRTIIDTISSSRSPPFSVAIHRPPTLEQLARDMQVCEQRHLLRRLILSIVVAIPTFIIGIVYMTLVKEDDSVRSFLMEPMWTGNTSRSQWALFFLATPVMFYSANLFHWRSIKEIRALWRKGSSTPILKRFLRFGSMNLLVSSGVSVAYFSSVGLLGLAASQPVSHEHMGDSATYFDSVVFLTMFLLAGRLLEAYSKTRTADTITALSSLRPAEALLLPCNTPVSPTETEFSSIDDLEKGDATSEEASFSTKPGQKIEKIPVDLLEVGDIVRIPVGCSPPADGIIVAGEDSAFDESSLTGESKPVAKHAGDKVYLGTINRSKMVHIIVDSAEGGTMLDNIVKVVREGQTRRAPIARIADVITGYFVPVVTLLAILTWVMWVTLGLTGALPDHYLDIEIGGWPVWSLQFAIAVFVVACPCGIGLAAPTALFVGSGLAGKFGILAYGGGEAFQEMAQVDLVVFDKTGTLTEGGEAQVSDAEFISNSTWERSIILSIAAELESTSSHPMATAIKRFCENKGLPSQTGSSFEEKAGRGLKASFHDLRCTSIIGNEAWMQEHGAAVDGDVSRQIEEWKSEAKSIILLAIRDERTAYDGLGEFHIAAIFAVSDPLRAEAPSAVSWFQKQGISTWMISGDNITSATAVATTVGIPSTNVIAGVLPQEKAQWIQRLQREGPKRRTKTWRLKQSTSNSRCIVAMVGDGINDAPALTTADVGIAIGSGSDVAISSASFILLSSNLRSLITLTDLSRRIINRVKFNFVWAVVYNLTALPVAAGVLYPVRHVRLNPVWASLAMALSSVSVVCSSLLLKVYKEPTPP